MVKFGNIKGANKDLGRANRFNVFSLLSGVSLQQEGQWRAGGGHLSPWSVENNGQSPCPALGSPPEIQAHRSRKAHQADGVCLSTGHSGPGEMGLGSLETRRMRGWHLQPPCSQAQRHWARPFGEEHRDRTTHCSSNSQAGRQEIARYKGKVIYSEVAQTLEQVCREAVQSPCLEIQKAHLAKRPMSMWTLARGGIRDLQGPFLLTFL